MAKARMRPTISAPARAPRIEPRPPITTTANASMTKSIAMSSEAAAVCPPTPPPPLPPPPPAHSDPPRMQPGHVGTGRFRHGAVPGGRAQDSPVIGSLQKCSESGRRGDRGGNHQQIVDRHAELARVDHAVDEIGAVERTRIRP